MPVYRPDTAVAAIAAVTAAAAAVTDVRRSKRPPGARATTAGARGFFLSGSPAAAETLGTAAEQNGNRERKREEGTEVGVPQQPRNCHPGR